MSKSVKAHPEQEETFFLPDLCDRQSVFFLVIIAELFSLVIVMVDSSLFGFDWMQLGLVSLFVQWVALSSAGILCKLRGYLRTLPQQRAVLISYLLIPANTWIMSAISQTWFSFNPNQTIAGILFSNPVLTHVAIAAIIGGLVIRYFYLQAMLIARRQSELLHRIQALQSRIRPHFLFNSMNIIASLIETDPRTAETVVEDLSALFRASLNHVGNQVPLNEEIDLCNKYLNIEKLRLGKRLDVQWEIRSVPQQVRIPLLTLQPLLENAVLHGVQPLPQGGIVEILASYSHGVFEITITNPYVAKAGVMEPHGNRMALENTRNRLAALYGDRAKLTGYAEGNRYITRLSYPYPVTNTAK
ncbi:MAG: histidine kinase [Pseudomonadales bacterium]|jgi:two-component system, LytTR family, sensor histidine kinase AlgZ|uniref:sensor histidine kinase n=1 Tax=unclassified Ketobacter TaxID=2639109 RepID=UPI000C8F6486|nr:MULTISPECIES: histidine kinase [unclassified Ketobacter]MAQ23539.1 histidine kinase [Pseudomonadales bacterium]MEC8813314.1 histidine kinase [Pseudomonadota bacterium]TNC89215.1 MAG: histidine kinase [Alcanivorax sp.]HAU12270.1 histidine kinase [Gammaproteobacteria bacterium]RLT90420.1 MAG: sensor histidine kinase [Ketobacter sp. GenoA1]|tara:strand:+ start:944 stop:2017 length:1074 start_codon:yes stop_codon:yes gene_type:complete